MKREVLVCNTCKKQMGMNEGQYCAIEEEDTHFCSYECGIAYLEKKIQSIKGWMDETMAKNKKEESKGVKP